EDAAVLAALLDAREEALVRRAAFAPLGLLVLNYDVRQPFGRVHAYGRIVGLRDDVHVRDEARSDGECDADADLQPFLHLKSPLSSLLLSARAGVFSTFVLGCPERYVAFCAWREPAGNHLIWGGVCLNLCVYAQVLFNSRV